MALAVNKLYADRNSTTTAAPATGSVTPTASSRLLYLIYAGFKSGGGIADVPTSLSGTGGMTGLTWTSLGDLVVPNEFAFDPRMAAFTAIAPASPSAGTVVANYAVNHTGFQIVLLEYTDTATPAVLQSKWGVEVTSTDLSVLLDTQPLTVGSAVGMIFGQSENTSLSPGTGLTGHTQPGATTAGGDLVLRSIYDLTTQTNPLVGTSSRAASTGDHIGGLAYEIGTSTNSPEDTFDGPSIDTSRWVEQEDGTSTVAISSGAVVATLGGTTDYATLAAQETIDLTAIRWSIEVPTVIPASDTQEQVVAVALDDDNQIGFTIGGATQQTHAFKKIAGSLTKPQSAAYSAANHRYLGFRVADGTAYWETSTDGVTWTTYHSEVAPIVMTAVEPWFGVGAFGTVTAGSGSFDNAVITTITAPIATINHPAAIDGDIPEGLKVSLEATTTAGTGSVTSEQWSTDQGDVIPTGPDVQIVLSGTNAVPKTHALTYTVQDDLGFTSTDTTTITVGTSGTTILGDTMQTFVRQTGVATTLPVALSDSSGDLLTSNPLAAGDVTLSVDGAAAAVLTDDANAATWTFVNGCVHIPLTAAEVSGEFLTLAIKDADGTAYRDVPVHVVVTEDDRTAAGPTDAEIATAVATKFGISGSVNDAAATTTSFIGAVGLSATDDFYNGAVLTFTSGTLDGIARRISGYTGASLTLTFTTAFPAAPADGDTFLILGRID